MLFKKASNTTEQGDIGEARAIYEFIKAGYVVSKPINDKAKYDIIVDDGDTLSRVQVKTTAHKKPRTSNGYEIGLVTKYSTRTALNIRKRQTDDYDILFILVETGDVWIIPCQDIESKSTITVGTKKYEKYKI